MIPTTLVVEDNPMNLELVRDLLTTAGMKVVEARTARPEDLREIRAGHRGKIGMENAETGGARFWVELFRAPRS